MSYDTIHILHTRDWGDTVTLIPAAPDTGVLVYLRAHGRSAWRGSDQATLSVGDVRRLIEMLSALPGVTDATHEAQDQA